ncbi:hypothetical protein [Parashewanella tropica]|uniref:hypothetical protein n=1 Tax=Parashewanella tropica TaxID=2547970 RepID=UPI00105A1E7E|nr:hypothetical protein [Parashewanella tropica]
MTALCSSTNCPTQIGEAQQHQYKTNLADYPENRCDLAMPLSLDNWKQLEIIEQERLLLAFEEQLSSDQKSIPYDLLALPSEALQALIQREPTHLLKIVSLMGLPLSCTHQPLLKSLCAVFEQTFSESDTYQADYFLVIQAFSEVVEIRLSDYFLLSMASLKRWHSHIPDVVDKVFLQDLSVRIDASAEYVQLRSNMLQTLLFNSQLSLQKQRGLWIELALSPIPLISEQETQAFYQENWMKLSGLERDFDKQCVADYCSAYELLDSAFSDSHEVAQVYYFQLLEFMLDKMEQHFEFIEYDDCSDEAQNIERNLELRQCMELSFHIIEKLFPKPLNLIPKHQALLYQLVRTGLCRNWQIAMPFYCLSDEAKVGGNLVDAVGDQHVSQHFLDYQRTRLPEPLKTAHNVKSVHTYQSARRQLMVCCLRMSTSELEALCKHEIFSYKELCLIAVRLPEARKQVFTIAKRDELAHKTLAQICAKHKTLAEHYFKTFPEKSHAWRAKVAMKHPNLMKKMWKEFEKAKRHFSELTMEEQTQWKKALVFLCDSAERAQKVLPFALAHEDTERLLCQILIQQPDLVTEAVVKRIFSAKGEEEKDYLVCQYGRQLQDLGVSEEQIKASCSWCALSSHPELPHELDEAQLLKAAKYNRSLAKTMICAATPEKRLELRRQLKQWPELFAEHTVEGSEQQIELNSLEAGYELLNHPERWEFVNKQSLYALATSRVVFAHSLLFNPQFVSLARQLTEEQVCRILVIHDMWDKHEVAIRGVFQRNIDPNVAKNSWLFSTELMIKGIELGYITSSDITDKMTQIRYTEKELELLLNCDTFTRSLSYSDLSRLASCYKSFAIHLLNSPRHRCELTLGQLFELSKKYDVVAQGIIQSVDEGQLVGLSAEQWLAIASAHPRERS